MKLLILDVEENSDLRIYSFNSGMCPSSPVNFLKFYINEIFSISIIISGNSSFIKNIKLQNNKISVSIVKKIILDIVLLFFSVYYEPKCISNIVHVST